MDDANFIKTRAPNQNPKIRLAGRYGPNLDFGALHNGRHHFQVFTEVYALGWPWFWTEVAFAAEQRGPAPS